MNGSVDIARKADTNYYDVSENLALWLPNEWGTAKNQ